MANLIELMFSAPVVATRDKVLHAVTMDGLPMSTWPEGRCRAACDGEEIGLLPVKAEGQETFAMWPPRVSSLPAGWSRCRECMKATSEKRPRSEFARSFPDPEKEH